jgi:2-succinyl-6-hydroxy-2,4-cyclohexadiene-1-carboxylate synthase
MGGIQDQGFEDRRARLVAETTLEGRELGASYRAANPEGVRRFMAIEARNQPPPTRQALREPMTLERLETIRVPTLLVSGDEDVFAPPSHMRMMADRIEGARLEVIAGAGHCAYWEQPGAWNRIVIDFLHEVGRLEAKNL